MDTKTRILTLLSDDRGLNINSIKEILKVSLDEEEAGVKESINDLEEVGAIEKKDDLIKITGKGKRRLPRIKEKLNYRLPYWLGSWTMLIFDIPETDKKKRDQLRYRLKKYNFGMIQSSIWISPHDMPEDLRSFIKERDLNKRVKTFAFSVKKDDLDSLIRQAWEMKKLNKKYESYVENAKERFELVKDYNWKSSDIKRKALKVLAQEFKEKYHKLQKNDPKLPRSILSNKWQGFRAHHIYEQLEKYF